MTDHQGIAGSVLREEKWRELLRLSQMGDREAYATLLSDLIPLLRGVVRQKWRNEADVEDIVQEILLSLHTARHTYDPDRPFRPWLMTIVSRRIADMAHSSSHRASHETYVEILPETSAGSETKIDQDRHDDGQTFQRALSELPAGQRRALELLKIEGLSLKEASAITGKSVASLKVTVHRAVKAMQRALREG